MQQYKQSGNKDPLYEHLGGTSAKYLNKYGRPRPDGKSLSRVVRLTVAAKSDYFLTADSGPGEENKTGLIVPRFGSKPEQHVSVILSWRQLNELLLTTVEHYLAYRKILLRMECNPCPAYCGERQESRGAGKKNTARGITHGAETVRGTCIESACTAGRVCKRLWQCLWQCKRQDWCG